MMNRQTRKLSKCVPEIKMEFEPYLMDCDPMMDIDSRTIPEIDETTADYVRGSLTVSVLNFGYEGYLKKVSIFYFFMNQSSSF